MSHGTQFHTNDLALAATLVVCGYKLTQVDRGNPRRVIFIFDNSFQLAAAIDSYWQDELSVSPKKYFDTVRDLKSRIYNG